MDCCRLGACGGRVVAMGDPVVPRSWKYRRRAVFLTLIGSGLMLAYLAVWGGAENALQRAIAEGLTTTIWLTIATYVGGATADDALRDRYGKGTSL